MLEFGQDSVQRPFEVAMNSSNDINGFCWKSELTFSINRSLHDIIPVTICSLVKMLVIKSAVSGHNVLV